MWERGTITVSCGVVKDLFLEVMFEQGLKEVGGVSGKDLGRESVEGESEQRSGAGAGWACVRNKGGQEQREEGGHMRGGGTEGALCPAGLAGSGENHSFHPEMGAVGRV